MVFQAIDQPPPLLVSVPITDPPLRNRTEAMGSASEVCAVTVTVPVTVAPSAGEVIETVGAALSTLNACVSLPV